MSIRPGCDRVDGHPVGADLAGERLRPADHSGAHRVREREVVDRIAHRARRDVHDASVSASAKLRQAEVGQADRREQQKLDGALHGLVGDLECGPARRAAAVVDEDVDSAERLDRLLDESREVLRVGQVAADRQPAEAIRLARELVAPAGEHGDVGTLGGERLRAREPDPGGGATDDRRSSAESEVHAQPAGRHCLGTANLLPDSIVLRKSAHVSDGIVPDLCRPRRPYALRTPTTSRTASAEAPSAALSSSVRSSSTIASIPPAPSFTGTPM